MLTDEQIREIENEKIERLIRERDAARAELAENEAVIAVWRGRTERAEKERDEARAEAETYLIAYENVFVSQEGLILTAVEAEQRGYRRGIEEAAKVAKNEWSHEYIAEAILAFLEQAEPSLSPEDKPA